MIRKILATAAGLVVAFAVVMLGELIAHRLFPIEMPTSMNDAALAAAMAAAPLGAKLSLAVIYFLAPLAGTFTALAVARRQAVWPAYVVTGLFLLAAAANFFMLPHPLWLVVACVAAILVGGWLGIRLARR